MAKSQKQLKKERKAEVEKNFRQRAKAMGYVSYRKDVLPEWRPILNAVYDKLKAALAQRK